MRKLILLHCLWLFGFLFPAFLDAQSSVQGKVTESSTAGEPLIGVNIYVKGDPGTGTTSDLDGRYELVVPAGAEILIFSYLGYEDREVPIEGRTTIDVALGQSAELLDEVIVSAFGVKREKKSIGYAAQNVSGDDLVNSRETNLVSALSSKVAGVNVISTSGNPGASANIAIRGRTSFSDNNSPLFVIDGVPIDNDYAGSNFTDQSNRAIDLDPNDIESVTVLKGTAATALYGIRAGKGAIVITTRRSKADGQTNVSFSTSLTFDQVNKLPGQQDRFAQGQGGAYIDPQSGSPSSWGPLIDTLRYADDPDYTYSQAGRIVGQSNPAATDRQVTPFDNAADFFQTGITSNSSLNVSGGTTLANYLISLGHHRQSGIVPKSDFERTNVKLAGAVNPGERLSFSGQVAYSLSGGNRQQRGSNLSGVMLGLMRTPPTFDLSNGIDEPVDNPAAYSFADGSQRKYNASYDNPYWSVNRNQVRDRVNRVIGHVQMGYDLTPSLNLLYRLGLDYYFEERKSYWDGESGEFRSINGLVINDLYSFSGLTSDLLLTYDRRLGEQFTLDVTLGHSYYQQRAYGAVEEGENFVIPGFYDISNAQTLIVDDYLSREKITGAFYELRLGFNDYLYLSTTGRNDWSSTLPAANNAFFYPSVSLGFVFTEPLGLATNSVFSYGKLRASYGAVGNDAPGPYLLDLNYSSVGQIQGQTAFLLSNTIGNEGIVPERNESYEFGLELRLFQNRLGFDLAYYRNLTTDQIVFVPIANSTGFTTIVDNAGKIENKGFEALVNISPVRTPQFSWNIDLNFSTNENIVLELADGIPFLPLPGFGLTSTRNVIIEGQPYGVIYGTRWLRNEEGDVLIDANGYPIQDSENGIVGDPNPDWLMGIRNTLSWKGFSLTALLDIRKGGDIFNGTKGVMRNLGIHIDTGSREEEVIFEGVLQTDGMPNTIPIRLDQDFYSRYPFAGVSEASIEDGSYLRLRELGLTYRFPASWFERAPFSDLRFGLTARNLLLLTDYTGIDPETNLSGASNSFGRDYFNTPNTRSYGANLVVTF